MNSMARKIINTIKDIEGHTYEQLDKVLRAKGLIYDGMLISVESQRAYLWCEILPGPILPGGSIRA